MTDDYYAELVKEHNPFLGMDKWEIWGGGEYKFEDTLNYFTSHKVNMAVATTFTIDEVKQRAMIPVWYDLDVVFDWEKIGGR